MFLQSNGRNEIFLKEIEWLGCKISESGVIPIEEKTLSIKSIPIPRNLMELYAFFGSTNQFMEFVPNSHHWEVHCHHCLASKKLIFTWSDYHTKASGVGRQIGVRSGRVP